MTPHSLCLAGQHADKHQCQLTESPRIPVQSCLAPGIWIPLDPALDLSIDLAGTLSQPFATIMACTLTRALASRASRLPASCEVPWQRTIAAGRSGARAGLGCGSGSSPSQPPTTRRRACSAPWSCNWACKPTRGRRCSPARALPEAAAAMTADDLATPFLWFNSVRAPHTRTLEGPTKLPSACRPRPAGALQPLLAPC